MKLSFLRPKEIQGAHLEANILIKEKNPKIVECFEIFEDSFGGSKCLMILLEYCPVNWK